MSDSIAARSRAIIASALADGNGDAAELHTLFDDTNQLIRQQVCQSINQSIAQVLEHHTSLVSHTVGMESLQSSVDSITAHTATVNANVIRAQQRTNKLYDSMKTQTRQLSRLHSVSSTVRAISRMVTLTSKLRDAQLLDDNQVINPRDLAKLAGIVEEAEQVAEDTDLTGITVVAECLSLLPRYSSAIGKRATTLLSQAVKQANQQHGQNALLSLTRVSLAGSQVIHLLHTLQEQLCTTFSQIGGNNEPIARGDTVHSQATVARAKLWTDVTRWSESTLPQTYHAVHLLAKLVANNQEAMAAVYKPYYVTDEKSDDKIDPLEMTFWSNASEGLLKCVTDEIRDVTRQTLANEYPKLLRLCADAQMSSQCTLLVYAAWKPLGETYLTQSRRRMQEAVDSGNVTQLVRVIETEIANAAVEESLATSVMQITQDAIANFVHVSMQQYDEDATQVIDKASPAQMNNVTIVNSMHSLWSRLSTLLLQEPRLSDSRDTVSTAITRCVAPIGLSAMDACESILATMYDEQYGVEFNTTTQCSLYMQELQAFIARLAADHISPLKCSHAVDALCVRLGSRLIQLYMTHATLVRPVSTDGRMRLAVDAAQLELAMEPLNLIKHEGLKREYECLRALREALLLSPGDVLKFAHLGDRLPFSLAIQLVISRSADQHLLSPHKSVDWSMSRYVQWLADHPNEIDRVKLLNGTVESYTLRVQAAGESKFAEEYPILCQLLKQAVATRQQ